MMQNMQCVYERYCIVSIIVIIEVIISIVPILLCFKCKCKFMTMSSGTLVGTEPVTIVHCFVDQVSFSELGACVVPNRSVLVPNSPSSLYSR